jgi:uncharacterized Zn finger protein
MNTPKIIKEYPNCPVCGGMETISHLAIKSQMESGRVKSGTFSSLRQQVTPLLPPMLAALTVECVLVHFDICAECGTERCTKAELIQAPVQARSPQGSQGFNPFASRQ